MNMVTETETSEGGNEIDQTHANTQINHVYHIKD